MSAPLDWTKPQQEQKDCQLVLVSPDQTSVQRDRKLFSVSCKCKLSCCKSCTYYSRAAPKKRHQSGYCKTTSVIKICEHCFLCRLIVFCKTCTKHCTKSACRAQTEPILENLGSLGGQTQSSTNVERRLHPTFQNQTKLDQTDQSSAAMYILTGTCTCWRHFISWQTKMQSSWSKIKNLWVFTTGYVWSQNQTTNGYLY